MKKNRADRIGENRTAFEKNRLVIMRTQNICGICGKPVDRSLKYPHPMSASVDHIIPIEKGGHPSDLANLQLAHLYCNRVKAAKLFDAGITREQKEAEAVVNNDDLPWSQDWRTYKAN